MNLVERNGLRILIPSDGRYIATIKKDAVYEGQIYLGKFDSIENYIEITEQEKLEMEKLKDEKDFEN